jgi:hypothetical protein
LEQDVASHESKSAWVATQDEDVNMETILEDPSMDYVMVSNTTPQDESMHQLGQPVLDTPDVDISNSTGTPTPSQWLTTLQSYAQLAAQKSVEWTRGMASMVRPGIRSTIYSSYDWVSDTMIDGGEGRLILPGPLIVLDPSTRHIGKNTDNPKAAVCSMTESSTIMVSAHDLLATQTSSSEEPTHRPAITTTSVPKALWKMAKRKTHGLMRSAQTTIHRSSDAIYCSVGCRLTQVEQNYRVFSITSDLVSSGYDWCFPPDQQCLEENNEVTHPQHVMIELASRGEESPSTTQQPVATIAQEAAIAS